MKYMPGSIHDVAPPAGPESALEQICLRFELLLSDCTDIRIRTDVVADRIVGPEPQANMVNGLSAPSVLALLGRLEGLLERLSANNADMRKVLTRLERI